MPNELAFAPEVSARLCPKCGAQIFPDAEICVACLLEIGLAPNDEAAVLACAAFGDYELLGEIGRGGQGIVYRARQKSLHRVVALKVIGAGLCANESDLKRFRREAEAAASLQHPRIIPIYEIGERDGVCFFSMQLIDGGQLDEFVRQEPPSAQHAAKIVASLARTVEHAHERGVLHRDIKPGNILLDREGEPHLADFGLARLVENESTITRTLDVLGTPSYVAPEQAAGDSGRFTKATDVYGLGAVLYFLLTGHPPFAGGTTYETIRLVLETEPRNPKLWNAKLDRDLATICLKCLEKDPQRRYPSALALAEDLERWLRHEPIQARRSSIVYRSRKWIRRNPSAVALCSLGTALLGVLAFLIWNREPPLPAGIAVLPFANLDGDKQDTVFADGIQVDILTRLASLADLKVISRRSVMHYRGQQNTREIGNALHVSYLLEGSVRRSGNSVRLNIQLIDARADQEVWSEEYNRALDDVSAVQGDIAQQVADELHVKLSPREKEALAHPPTHDLQAYDFYICGMALIDAAWTSSQTFQDLERSIEFFHKALARDPNFLLAYCALAKAHDLIWWTGERTPGHLEKANSAVQTALRLGPNSGEAHLARALHFLWGYLDYARARTELQIAGRTLPNDARIAYFEGGIDRRQGRWAEASREFQRATELDPRNEVYLNYLAVACSALRDYDKLGQTLDRALALAPNDINFRMSRAGIDCAKRGDMRPANAVAESILAHDPDAIKAELGPIKFRYSMYAHDFAAAYRYLKAVQDGGADALPLSKTSSGISAPLAYFEGWVLQSQGKEADARLCFLAARREEEKRAANLDLASGLCGLGAIDARLGRKEDALREGRRALELMPLTKDSLQGEEVLHCFTFICAWTGERDLALVQLEKLAKIPYGPSYGELLLDPSWDSLRADPRFQKILSSLAPRDPVR